MVGHFEARRTLLAAAVALASMVLLILSAGATSAQAGETRFCWGETVEKTGPDSVCYESGHSYATGVYASGVEHSICVNLLGLPPSKRKCSGGPGQAVYLPLTPSEGFAFPIIESNGAGPTKVYGALYWNQAPPPAPPPPPPAWNNESIGGSTPSDPDVASWDRQRLDVFARGSDNSLCHQSWDPVYGWSGWQKIPGPAITSGPSAVSWGPGRIDVVARIADGSVEHWGWESGIWSHENLGGNITADPDIASWGDKRLDVFARGTDEGLFHKSWDPIFKWASWQKIPGPTITSGPGAVSWGNERIDVVARVAGNSVWHWSWGTY